MKKHFAIFSVLVLFAFCSCNKINLSGHNIDKDFGFDGTYTELEVSNAFDVVVSDTADRITITTDENIMPHVVVEKIGKKLRICLEPLTINTGTYMDVVLPYNADLTSVDLSGASEFHSEYGLHGENVVVELSGASKIESDIAAIDLELYQSGSSEATLKGQVGNLKIDMSGASKIIKKMVEGNYSLACDQCKGEMSGSSTAHIHCDGNINVSLSGASDLHYTGNATTFGSTTSGSSSIHQD